MSKKRLGYKNQSATGFATPSLKFCAKQRSPVRYKTFWTGLYIPSGLDGADRLGF